MAYEFLSTWILLSAYFAFISIGIIILNIIYLKRKTIKTGDNTYINNLIESTTNYLNKKINKLEEKIMDSNVKSEQALAITSKIEQNYENQQTFSHKLSDNIKILTKAQIIFTKNLSTIAERLQELKKPIQYNIGKNLSDINGLKNVNFIRGTTVEIPKLTPTEMTVLKVLATSGSKTASEIREIIGKTREHSARLMKKLFLEGYIQRDTSTIPYSYKINESIKDSIEFSQNNV